MKTTCILSGKFLAVLAAATVILLSRPCLAQTLANPFLDDSQVQTINLTMAPSDWATLQANYLLDTYYAATFTWNGISENIGVRSHGGGSRSPIKPNLDVNFAHFDETQTLLGLPFVVLKANNEDPSNMAEWISMKLFRKMGMPAPREAPAQVFLNGHILGFYYIVEHEDETFLQRNFGESGGYLYEWEPIGDNYDFGNLGTNPSLYAPYLELKSDQTVPDLQTFTNMVQVINQPSSSTFTDADFVQALSQYLDPDQFMTYGAIDQVLADADGMIGGLEGLNNFYLYQYQGTTDYYFIPWDKDLTFSLGVRDILDGISNGPNINVLAQRLYGIPQYQQVYLNALVNAAMLMGGTGGWADSEVTREYGVISSAATDDPNKQCPGVDGGPLQPCGNQQFLSEVQWLHAFLSQRSGFVQSQAAGDGYQPLTGGPQITALSTNGGTQQLSPGALAVVNGVGLAPAGQAYALPLPRILQNETTFVAAAGVRAPLLVASDGSIQFQLPLDIPAGSVSIVVSNNGALSNTFDVPVQASTPSIIGVVHADGSNVSLSSPPIPGEVVSVYATGLGAVSVNLPIGAAAPGDPLAMSTAVAQITLGTYAMATTFSGLVPGYIALYQVNAVVPSNLPLSSSYTGCTLTISGQSAGWQFPPS
jgi:uncharacterized protein (TIGR03437 family)